MASVTAVGLFVRMSAASPTVRATVYTTIAMLAFAGNSILCRMALLDRAIDPASFTAIRILSGALALLLIVYVSNRDSSVREHGGWTSASMLFAYAIFFSYAYISLNAGVGALILFGFVQGTMIAMALWSGDRPGVVEWAGWLLAFAGLVWLLLPGIEAPPAMGAILMALAGIAWGVYSIRGRSESNSLVSTCSNFVYALVFVAILVAITGSGADISSRGLLLALVSGALTSGLGYVIWYAALNYLNAMQAALVQLSVPAIAAIGGILLLAEPVSIRLLTSGTLILGGISLALTGKSSRISGS